MAVLNGCVEWLGEWLGGMAVWNGCVEWLCGMAVWNGCVEWLGGMVGFFAVKRRVVFVLLAMPSTS